MNTWAVTGVALLGWCVLPGLGAALLWADEDDPGPVFARATGFGMAIWILGSQLLSETIGLSTFSTWVACGALGAAGTVAVVRRRRLLGGLRRPMLTGLVVVLLALAAWAPMFAVSLREPDSFVQPTPWYYWHNAELVAQEGSPPETVREWGTTTTYLGDYPGFTASTAALIVQTPGDDHVPAQATMVVAVATSVIGLGAVIGRLGGTRIATLIAALAFLSTHVFALKLGSYRPEGLGYGLALLAAAMALSWLLERRRAALVAGGLAFLALGQVHGIVFVLGAVLVGSAVIATLDRTLRRGWAGARAVGVLVGSWSLGWLLWSLPLNVGFSGAGQVDRLSNVSGLDDPTWGFIRAITGRGPSLPPTNAELARRSLDMGFVGSDPWLMAAVAGAVLGLLAVRALGRPLEGRAQARRALAIAAAGIVGVLIVCFWFGLAWESYVPRRTGFGRLLQLLPILVPLGLGVAVSTGFRARRTALALSATLAVGLLVATLGEQPDLLDAQQPPPSALSTLESLDLETDALVLTNAYTEAFVPEVLRTRGLLDGRAPYTYPDLLARATRLLKEAQAFYADPASNLAFLRDEGVTHVIAARPGSRSLGTAIRFSFDGEVLDSLPQLTEIARDPDLTVYRVENAGR